MSGVALVLYLAGLAVTFGVRTAVHRRRTGSSGFHGISGTPATLGWWGGALFVAALVLGVAAPALAVTGAVAPTAESVLVQALGLTLVVGSLAGVLLAQTDVGAPWGVGVDEHSSDSTDLVTSRLFAVVRNPVFSAMLLAQTGMLLLFPTWLSLLALACLFAAVEIQVRVLEEPYLLRAHGQAFASYAARTGRLVPGLGGLDASTGPSGATA